MNWCQSYGKIEFACGRHGAGGSRTGAFDGSVVDYDFGTTDVFMILRVESISPRYINYYSAEAERFLA